MIDEQGIRDAYEVIASRAMPAERVRARLAARGRRAAQRRALLVGAGALGTAAVATGIGVPLARGRRRPAEPADFGPGAAEPDRLVRLGRTFGYAPAWLPAGVGEQFRSTRWGTVNGSTRRWLPAGVPYPEDGSQPPGVTFSEGNSRGGGHSGGVPAGDKVDIGPVAGVLWVTDAAYVQWQPPGAPELLVVVRGLPDAAKTALRVARSVSHTGGVVVDAAGQSNASIAMDYAMYSPWVPDRFCGFWEPAQIGTTHGYWQSMTYSSTDNRYRMRISVRTGPVPAVDAGAYAVTRPGGVTVWIPRDRTASAAGYRPLTSNEANRMLNEFQYKVFPGDLAWVGRR